MPGPGSYHDGGDTASYAYEVGKRSAHDHTRKGFYRPTKHWSKLKDVRGYDRVPDYIGLTGHIRMLECHGCGLVLSSLGVGYHVQGKAHYEGRRACSCFTPDFGRDVTVFSWDGSCAQHSKACDLNAGPGYDRYGRRPPRPVYGPPLPTPEMLEAHARMLAWEAHCALPTEKCEYATTATGCWVHPADIDWSRLTDTGVWVHPERG